MEFQNEPFQALKDRVEMLEEQVEEMVTFFTVAALQASTEKPETVREEQDDA